MNYDDTKWMEKSLCATNEEAQKLFMSPFLEKFSENDFYEDHIGNEKLSTSELEAKKKGLQPLLEEKRTEHELAYSIYTGMAKSFCQQCPVFELCNEYRIEKEQEGVEFYGVIAGLTNEERKSRKVLFKQT